MKSQKDIERMLDYLEKLNDENFIDDTGRNWLNMKYKAMHIDSESGEPVILKGDEAFAILGNMQMAIDTLKWVLEESGVYRPPRNEQEVRPMSSS
jgi:hypothetical protein